MSTLSEVLKYCELSNVLTDEIVQVIQNSALATMEAIEIAKYKIPELAELLFAARNSTDSAIPCFNDERQCGSIARSILSLPEIEELKSLVNDIDTSNLQVTVTPEEKKSSKELLVLLKADPTNVGFLTDFDVLPLISKIYQQTEAIAFYGEQGLLNVDLTQDYLDYLAKGYSPLSKFMDKKPDTLRNVLNGVQQVWQHPLFEGQSLHNGVDIQRNMDWNSIGLTMVQAVLWGRLTDHDEFPVSVQVRAEFTKIQNKIEHWAAILRDYNDYIDRGGQEQSLLPIKANPMGKFQRG
jgi:hypothetical protein